MIAATGVLTYSAHAQTNTTQPNSTQTKTQQDMDAQKRMDEQNRMNKNSNGQNNTDPMNTNDSRMQNDMQDDRMKNQNGMMMPDLKSWPEASQMAAKEAMDKYGKPDVMAEEMLVWKDKGMWKKMMVTKTETKHDWPVAHTDMFEQCVSYRVPVDKVDELAKFDGSVTYKRTEGLLSARCDKEAMNILALNLAVEIAKGNKNAEQARMEFTKNAMAFKKGEKPEITQKLMFTSNASAADPDKPADMSKPTGMVK